MTRINVIPASLQLDQHLAASVREGLRPIHDVFDEKGWKKAPDHYKLGEGHVKFMRKVSVFTLRQWREAKLERTQRGFDGFDWDTQGYDERLSQYPVTDYKPTVKDYRHNLARIIYRWRDNPHLYTYCKRPVKTIADMRAYVNLVVDELKL